MADDQPFAPTASDSTGADSGETPSAKLPAKKAAAKKTTKSAAKKAPAKKAAAKKAAVPDPGAPDVSVEAEPAPAKAAAKKAPAKKAAAKKAPAKKAAAKKAVPDPQAPTAADGADSAGSPSAQTPLFQAPETTAPAKKAAKKAPAKKTPAKKTAAKAADVDADAPGETQGENPEQSQGPAKSQPRKKSGERASGPSDKQEHGSRQQDDSSDGAGHRDTSDRADDGDDGETGGDGGPRRRRRRGGRRRRKPGDGEPGNNGNQTSDGNEQADGDQPKNTSQGKQQGKPHDKQQDSGDGGDGGDGTSRRRRRRRREGDDSGGPGDDPNNTVTRVRKGRNAEDEITAVSGSTRLEAKKQRRREGREAGRRRAPIVSEAEFLARRESVERVMVIRQRKELTQIGVIEDNVLVEHYVARESQTSLIGNVYLGRVQNVLPSMEAAFIDIGKGRNAVLYAGEVNWSALGHKEGSARKIESVLSSGQAILVQVTKDPVGHKGARLTSQVSLAGRFLVYVPDGTTSGISRKLPDTERSRLKTLLKEIVPDSAGVIVRTAAEGASEEELTRDVERLKSRWEDIEAKTKGGAPKLLYGEPDLTLKVVRDLFTEDFAKLVIQGDDAWATVQEYVVSVAPDLEERLERYDSDTDVFATYRVDEQISKALDRKVWLPSGGSLVIDRTEAMTVVDVNTGKFTGSGGNLEETVTKNNLEAAEEVVRQLRLRDIGGIIVVDFIDMVLESNRDLVLRRLVECLGRDRTRHQVAEVTSLGLVQMTRKRIGTGLVESFSENCEHCHGRGVVIHDAPVEPKRSSDDESRRGGSGGGSGGSGGSGGGRRRGGRGRGADSSNDNTEQSTPAPVKSTPTPQEFAAMASADPSTVTATPSDQSAAPQQDETVDIDAAEGERGDVTSAPSDPSSAPQAPVAPVAPEPPKVVTRTRRRTASTAPSSSEPAAVGDPVPDQQVSSADSAQASPVPAADRPDAQEPTAPAAPAGPPTVVTRTRRSGASRTVEASAPAPVTVSAASASPAAPATPDADPAPAAAPPKVVTRTRGGAAGSASSATSRMSSENSETEGVEVPSMADVTAAGGTPGAPATSGLIEPNVSSAEPGGAVEDEVAVEHVPVKKKGSRKR